MLWWIPHWKQKLLTGSPRVTASTGWWKGQAKWWRHRDLITTFCINCSWLVLRPGLLGLVTSGGGGFTSWGGTASADMMMTPGNKHAQLVLVSLILCELCLSGHQRFWGNTSPLHTYFSFHTLWPVDIKKQIKNKGLRVVIMVKTHTKTMSQCHGILYRQCKPFFAFCTRGSGSNSDNKTDT